MVFSNTSANTSKTGNHGSNNCGPLVFTATTLMTIRSIKDVVGNYFSDSDIYFALKENNMEPNETAQKLLNQDHFHVVKSRRDKKKESLGDKNPVDPRKEPENFSQGMKARPLSNRSALHGVHIRNALSFNGRMNREFRVVRDNRVNQSTSGELKNAAGQSLVPGGKGRSIAVEKGSMGTSGIPKQSGAHGYSQAPRIANSMTHRYTRDANFRVTDQKLVAEERKNAVPHVATMVPTVKANDTPTLASSNSVVGVYSSSTDPVHVPSPDSRPSAAVGAIKREVGVVGGSRQFPKNALKDSAASGNPYSSAVLGRDRSSSELLQPFSTISKIDQGGQSGRGEPLMSSISPSRPFLSRQNSGKLHQQVVAHQKAPQHNKEWKPKSSQKSSATSAGVIGTPAKPTSPPADNPKDLVSDEVDLQDKLSQVNIYENQNVIIAQHIRVPETDKLKLTFGSFGIDVDPSNGFTPGFHTVGVVEVSVEESDRSLLVSAPETPSDDVSVSKQVNLPDEQVRNSGSDSPSVSEHQLPEKSRSSPDLENYADIGLVQHNSPSYDPSESQQQQDPPELQNFSAYDPQAGYDISYFRPPVDEGGRVQRLASPQEALNSHMSNNVPVSTISMVQQQQQQQPAMAQMYPQVHVSHFANLLPYRQFISPVYVPQMAVPGYSSNPAYPHPSNGNSYLLMPGGGSHLSANSLKYGIQQYKPVPSGSPTGFGNFTSPTGYPINAPGVVGSGTGLDDSSRMKYKDGSLYVPNPQADTSEIWLQNPRDLSGLQSSAYYNLPAQTPHATYLPSHAGHASFNAAAAQSSHMQFPGLYPPPPQPAAMANPHHMGPVMGGNVGGVGMAPTAPGAQVGAYQQPQLGHLNWATNF